MNRGIYVLWALGYIAVHLAAFVLLFGPLWWLLENGYAAHVGISIAVLLPVALLANYWEQLADFGELVSLLWREIRK